MASLLPLTGTIRIQWHFRQAGRAALRPAAGDTSGSDRASEWTEVIVKAPCEGRRGATGDGSSGPRVSESVTDHYGF